MKLELGFKQVDDTSVYVKNDVTGIDLVAAVCTGNVAWNGNFEAKQQSDTELRLKFMVRTEVTGVVTPALKSTAKQMNAVSNLISLGIDIQDGIAATIVLKQGESNYDVTSKYNWEVNLEIVIGSGWCSHVLLLEGESANETREGALSGLSQIAGGAVFRGLPRLCASFDQPASTCEADPEKGPRPIHPRVGVPI